MRTHRLHGLVLALLAAAGSLVILARPAPHADAAAPAGATATNAQPPGWQHLSEGVGAGAAQATAAALAAAAPPATNDADDLGSGTQQLAQLQRLRVYVGTLRAQQFNAMVATYQLQQLAMTTAQQAFAAAEAQVAFQQAAAQQVAAQQAAQAPATPAATPGPSPAGTPAPATDPAAPSGGVWAALRLCESGGDYADDTGNGYYGAYQFALSTWLSLGYSGLPSNAPPAVQDAAAQQLQARSGWGQWPACARKLGLI